MIYYQSIGERINGLSNYDQNVMTIYYPRLFCRYKELNPAGYDALIKKVKGLGVYTNEVEDYVKQYEQRKQLEQQYSEEELQAMYEAAQRHQQQGGDGEGQSITIPSAEAAAQEDQNVTVN